jgi:hypothetical protein
MIAYIVCEGIFDAQLLKRVLPQELLDNVEVVSAGGISAVKSLARSLIVRRQVPVAIVVDADVAPDLVQERLKNIEEIVESVSVNTPVKVIIAVPEIEIIFFQDSLLLSRLLGYEPSQDMLTCAAFEPRKTLEKLLSQSPKNYSYSEIISELTNKDIEIIRKASIIQEVIHFLQSVRETAKI